MKRVVEESKYFLREISDKSAQTNEPGRLSSDIQEVNDCNLFNFVQKKSISHVSMPGEQDVDSETPSGSISLGGRCKRRQIVAPQTRTFREKRYNLRRSTMKNLLRTKGASICLILVLVEYGFFQEKLHFLFSDSVSSVGINK